MTSFYDILGVEPSSTSEEIKSAYLFLAQKFHPDVNKGKEKEAAKRFIVVQAAYDVLSDRSKRRKYDFDNEESLKVKPPEVIEKQPDPVPQSRSASSRWADSVALDFLIKHPKRKRRSNVFVLATWFMIACCAAAVVIFVSIVRQIEDPHAAKASTPKPDSPKVQYVQRPGVPRPPELDE